MVSTLLHIFFAVAMVTILAGCAAYPAVQVAGHAMTGYDAAVLMDDYLPRKNIQGGQRCATDHDWVLERRLRERLKLYHHETLAAHVIDAKAYLVGPVQSRAQADHAIQTAATVQGLRTITSKFYHAPTKRQQRKSAALHDELINRLKKTSWLKAVDLRVETVGTNAVLIGRTNDSRQKAEALAIASEVGGITEIIDYISVRTPQPTPPIPGDELAGK